MNAGSATTAATGSQDNAACPPQDARRRFRDGLITPTSGWSAGYAQANIVMVPSDWAPDVLLFAQRNPQAVPLLDVSEAGETGARLAAEADLRTDIPLYRVWENGTMVSEQSEITNVWRDDLVTFLIGCSFSFETALLKADVPIRNVEQGRNVSMYTTNVDCRPAGRLSGRLVVSMRPIPPDKVVPAVQTTGRMPLVHGAPVHVGAPELLGIDDVQNPDYGDPVVALDTDVPVLWACGVTPHVAIMSSGVPFAITHAPGHMLITDLPDSQLQTA